MSTSSDFYKETDKTITSLNRIAIRRFREAQREAGLMKWDELTVIRVVKKLYKDLAADNRKAFLELARKVYNGVDPHGDKRPDGDWLDAFLLEYGPVTKYVYLHEVDRKRDRTTEAIIASTDKAKEFRRGLLYWGQMTAQTCLDVTDAAALKAWKDSGVKRVMWNTEQDDRVCGKCEPRDGKIYPIDKVPPKPHWGCRCWLIPVD